MAIIKSTKISCVNENIVLSYKHKSINSKVP